MAYWSPSSSSSRVEPAMLLKSGVTVPVGSSRIALPTIAGSRAWAKQLEVGLLPLSLRQLVRGLERARPQPPRVCTSRHLRAAPRGMLHSAVRAVMTRPGQNGVLAAALERSAESAQNRLKCHKSAPRSS